MKETTPSAMPPCFERWCQRFDDCFKTEAQKKGFRHYLGGLLGESERKNLTQMADNAVGVVYNRLHHFLTTAPWQASDINERRLKVTNQSLNTFKEFLEAFRTAIAYRFVAWLRENQDVFTAYKAGLGLIWA